MQYIKASFIFGKLETFRLEKADETKNTPVPKYDGAYQNCAQLRPANEKALMQKNSAQFCFQIFILT